MKTIISDRYDFLIGCLIQTRKDAGITQAELAKTLRKPQSYVSKIETKERRLDLIEFLDLSKALRANPHDLIDAIPETD